MKNPNPAVRVLFVTPEIAPWSKTGGLGDISAALPLTLRQHACDVRLLLPAYPGLRSAFPEAPTIAELPAFDGDLPAARLLEATTPEGLPLLLIDCPALYDRPGSPYQTPEGADWADNHLRFGLLSRIAALLGSPDSPLPWRPDIVHCNDWPAALTPAYLRYRHGGRGAATVVTVHNLAFQGLFPADTLAAVGLPDEAFAIDGVEFHGRLSFLKGGLQIADRITTVSPTYAREIRGPELGFGLDGLLRHRAPETTGILNGIDGHWNPGRDPHLVQRYDVDRLAAKGFNREALFAELRLEDGAEMPLLATVGRLTGQKGIDLILAVADELLALPARLAILGEGEALLEDGCRELAARHPGRVAAVVGFDEALAHRIEAGADIFLMPSRFEPCGLNQMYSLRYGTPPVARSTGGLADTVVDATPEALADGSANGFTFVEPTPTAFMEALRRAVDLWHERKQWRRLQRNGMTLDFSWDTAAGEYLAVYQEARQRQTA